MALLVDSVFFPFLKKKCVSHTLQLSYCLRFLSKLLSPQALTLVILIHSIIGKYAFNSLIWQRNG